MSPDDGGPPVSSAPARVLERGASTPTVVALRVLESGVWVEYGWADVARTVARVAAVLRDAQVAPGAEVAVVCGSRAEWALCVWATNAVGATAVAVSSQSDEATLQAVAEGRPGMWILEGLEAFDRVARCDTGDAPRLIIDDVEFADVAAGTGPEPSTWHRDVLGAAATDDDSRLAELGHALDATDLDAPALRLPEDADQVLSHRDLVTGGSDANDSAGPLRLEPGDEYLAFLPPTWMPEAELLVGSHPVSGATVSVGSRVGGGLAELAAVQPTVTQAPAEWWDAVAERVLRAAAEPAPGARRAMEQVKTGVDGGGFITSLARRSITRRMGLGRMRAARAFGSVADETAAVFDGLNVPLVSSPARPGNLAAPTAEDRPDRSSNSASLEEAK